MAAPLKKRETPPWLKIFLAGVVGASGTGSASFIPINYNAQKGFESVQQVCQGTVEVRTWRPYIYKCVDKDTITIYETSITDGAIVDKW